MKGVERGKVELDKYDPLWKDEANDVIRILSEIFGAVAKDIQHVGSTAIAGIKAKPILDIAVGVANIGEARDMANALAKEGFYLCKNSDDELLFGAGSYYDGTGNVQTHFIHVVKYDSNAWNDYIAFRDALLHDDALAKQYEELKSSLAARSRTREEYTRGKTDFCKYVLRKVLVRSYLGNVVHIVMDRPIGSVHPKHADVVYPINYGYIPSVFGGDGEELDVYLLGVYQPVREYDAKIVGIVNRRNDVEDKLIAAPVGMTFTLDEMSKAVEFQERFYDTYIETI